MAVVEHLLSNPCCRLETSVTGAHVAVICRDWWLQGLVTLCLFWLPVPCLQEAWSILRYIWAVTIVYVSMCLCGFSHPHVLVLVKRTYTSWLTFCFCSACHVVSKAHACTCAGRHHESECHGEPPSEPAVALVYGSNAYM